MHYEVLNQNTKKIWDQCAPFCDDFYLAGGTALALQIGHRISVDLDFFSIEPIKKTLFHKIEETIGGTISVLVNTKNELTLFIDGVKVTFLHYPFALKEKLVANQIVPIASIRDIASMKAYAMGRRRSLKDYVDLYFIISEKLVTLASIISDANTTYGEAFNDRLFCEQLLSPEDLDEEAIIWLAEPKSKDTMQSFFKQEIDLFLKDK